MISFIMPAFNESKLIARSITSIKDAIGGKEPYEIIVIDNGSSDSTAEIARGIATLVAVEKTNRTIADLRNIAARQYAKGEILAFIDSDTRLTPAWGERFLSVKDRLTAGPILVTGTSASLPESPTWIERSWFNDHHLKKIEHIGSGNMIVSRRSFDSIGGFDAALTTGEDHDFCLRARRAGGSIVNDPGFAAIHDGYPKTIRSFFLRERWHGVGDYRSLKDFLKSRHAIIAAAGLFILVASVAWSTALGDPRALLAYPAYLLATAIPASIVITGGVNRHTIFCVPLAMVYYCARACSLFDALKEKMSGRITVSFTRRPRGER